MARVQLTGPFFRSQPGKTFRANCRVVLLAIAQEAARDMQATMQATESRRRPLSIGGRSSSRVRGRIRSLSGKPWVLHSAASIDTSGMSRRDAIALNAAGANIERQTGAARKAGNKVRKDIKAALLKGIA